MSAEAALNRWYDFLTRITGKHAALLAEAREGCATLHVEADLDPGAMTNAWTGLNFQAMALETKVDDTWRDQVEPLFERSGVPAATLRAEADRGEATRIRMEWEREQARIAIFADAARRVLERARALERAETGCTQCGASIAVPPGTFQAVNLTCPACDAVNTFEPGTWVRMIEWFCAHALAEEAAFELWWPRQAAERARRGAREATLALIQAEETATLAWWRRYYEARAALVPRLAPAIEADVKGKMGAFYADAEREAAWRRAGRPRVA